MALSKLTLGFSEIRQLTQHVPTLLLRLPTSPLNAGRRPFSYYVTGHHSRLRYVNRKQQRTSSRSSPPKSTIPLPSLITKDRLILLFGGVCICGAVIAWNRYHNDKKEYEKRVRELHTTVKTGEKAFNEQRYEEAVEYYRKARLMVEQIRFSDEEKQMKITLNIVDTLGHLEFDFGNWSEAEVVLKDSERIMLKIGIDKDDDSYLDVIYRLAMIDTIYDRKEEALERFHYCITELEKKISVQDIYSSEYGNRVTLYGMVLTNFGEYTKHLGLLDASEHAFSKALNVCRSVLGPNHEQTSVLANDLATVYDEKGKFNKAIRLALKAIKIAENTESANQATYEYNLAHIFMHTGEISRARHSLQKALHLAEENEDTETKELAESSILKLEMGVS